MQCFQRLCLRHQIEKDLDRFYPAVHIDTLVIEQFIDQQGLAEPLQWNRLDLVNKIDAVSTLLDFNDDAMVVGF